MKIANNIPKKTVTDALKAFADIMDGVLASEIVEWTGLPEGRALAIENAYRMLSRYVDYNE